MYEIICIFMVAYFAADLLLGDKTHLVISNKGGVFDQNVFSLSVIDVF